MPTNQRAPETQIDKESIGRDSNDALQVVPNARGSGWVKVAEEEVSGSSVSVSVPTEYDVYFMDVSVGGNSADTFSIILQVNGYTSDYTNYTYAGTSYSGKSGFSLSSKETGLTSQGILSQNFTGNYQIYKYQSLTYEQRLRGDRTDSNPGSEERISQIDVLDENSNATKISIEVYAK